jgi:hypothetical protein
LKHYTSPQFWRCHQKLPAPVQELAQKNLDLLKTDIRHPSLHFKKIGKYYSIRVGLPYRALAVESPEGLVWFWIGNHSEYDRIIK